MTGLLVALYEEAELIIRELSFHRVHSIAQYNGFVKGRPVSLHLCGPGIQKKSHIFKWLKQHKFERIVNIGYAGALVPGFSIGELCQVSRLSMLSEEDIVLNKKSGEYMVTTNEVIFSYDEKKKLFLRTQAKLVDMEGYSLARILIEAGFALSKLEVFKLIGDLAGDAPYLYKEVKFRNFFTSKRLWQTTAKVASTGLFDSWLLYRRKKFLQKKLFNHILKYMEGT